MRRHGDQVAGVRLARVERERLLADRHRHAADQRVAVVVPHLAPRAAIDDRLVRVPARSLLALVRCHRHCTELDSLDRAPRRRAALEDLDSIKAGTGERSEKLRLLQRARDAAAPQLRIGLEVCRHQLSFVKKRLQMRSFLHRRGTGSG